MRIENRGFGNPNLTSEERKALEEQRNKSLKETRDIPEVYSPHYERICKCGTKGPCTPKHWLCVNCNRDLGKWGNSRRVKSGVQFNSAWY